MTSMWEPSMYYVNFVRNTEILSGAVPFLSYRFVIVTTILMFI